MRRPNIAFAILAAILSCVPALAQPRRIMGGSSGTNRYQFYYDTFLDPAVPNMAELGGATLSGEGVIHRVMFDRHQRVYFGYDVSIEVLQEPNTYRVTFSRLTMTSENIRQVLGSDASAWTQLATPDWGGPAGRNIQGGEVLALDLLRNNATGQKIVDYVTVQTPSSHPPSKLGPWPRDFIYETGIARDFRTDDAELKIDLEGITINGTLIPFNGGASGAALFFYVPMRGRFILSLTPHPELGFSKAGEVRGSTISFTIDDAEVSIVSSGRIAPGSGPFSLYVLREPTWVPSSGGGSTTIVGAADRLDQLIGRF